MKYESEILNEIIANEGHINASLHYESECIEHAVNEMEGLKMKYQSELIKEIADKRGHKIPSIHYQSECVESWIEETKGSYPKLCDYEGEWLNYITESPIGAFPYVTLSNVTEATINNVVPYEYKRAILNGSTKYRDIDTGEVLDAFKDDRILELVSVKMPVITTVGKNLFDGELEIGTVNADTGEPFDYNRRSRTANFLNINPNTSYSLKSSNDVYLFNRVFFYDSQKKYISNMVIDNREKIVTSPENARYIKLVFKKQVDSILEDNDLINISNNVQLEQGTQVTPYEPYKSNILTVNEPVELRGIGDVQDTLDLSTGEVAERIGEIVLDGSEERWELTQDRTNTMRFNCYSLNIPYGINGSLLKTDKLPYQSPTIGDQEGAVMGGANTPKVVSISIMKAKLPSSDIDGFKAWLSQNPITVQYQLATPIVKTVDLKIVDQNGNKLIKIKPIEGTMHLSTDGETIKPTFTGEIPVEAITQNLASFIKG